MNPLFMFLGAFLSCTSFAQSNLVSEKLAKFQPIQGVYSGTLNSTADGAPLGFLQITLTPETVTIPTDTTPPDERVVVKGRIAFQVPGMTRSESSFGMGDYDPATGNFKTSVTVNDSAGKAHTLDISGTILNNKFNGTIDADDYDQYSGTFTVVNDAPFPVITDSELSSRVANVIIKSKVYTGTYNAKGTVGKATLTLNSQDSSPDQTLLNLLLPIHTVSATISFDGTFDVLFPAESTYLDDTQNALRGATVATTATGTYSSQLECGRTVHEKGVAGFNCTMTTQAGTYPLEFVAAPAK